MALHTKQSKTKRQSQIHYKKPSRAARFLKRHTTREKILNEGTHAEEALPAAMKALKEAIAEITAGHSAGIWSPEQQQAAEARRAQCQAKHDFFCADIFVAAALKSKLDAYEAARHCIIFG